MKKFVKRVLAARGMTSKRCAVVAMVAAAMITACGRTADNGASDRSDSGVAINVAATPPIADSPGAAEGHTVTVYKNPSCTCCSAWAEHIRKAGFPVVAIDTNDLEPVKRRYGVAPEQAACHTALVNGYVIEGHVPAADIRRLLAERPAITGLAVPGMPVGSPGMEGAYKQQYKVLAFTQGKRTTVFASH